MKSFEYIAIAIAVAGALLYKWNLPGANLLIIIGLGALAFIYGLAGSVFNKIKVKRGNIMPFVVLSSITLAAGVLSLLFSHMYWRGSGLLALYSYIALPIVILINVYQMSQKSENPLNKMVVIRAAILIVALIVF
jgi:hypothetical protein